MRPDNDSDFHGSDRVMLFFGQIAPYKGLEYLVDALPQAFAADPALRLVIAGKVKNGCEDYWRRIDRALRGTRNGGLACCVASSTFRMRTWSCTSRPPTYW